MFRCLGVQVHELKNTFVESGARTDDPRTPSPSPSQWRGARTQVSKEVPEREGATNQIIPSVLACTHVQHTRNQHGLTKHIGTVR